MFFLSNFMTGVTPDTFTFWILSRGMIPALPRKGRESRRQRPRAGAERGVVEGFVDNLGDRLSGWNLRPSDGRAVGVDDRPDGLLEVGSPRLLGYPSQDLPLETEEPKVAPCLFVESERRTNHLFVPDGAQVGQEEMESLAGSGGAEGAIFAADLRLRKASEGIEKVANVGRERLQVGVRDFRLGQAVDPAVIESIPPREVPFRSLSPIQGKGSGSRRPTP